MEGAEGVMISMFGAKWEGGQKEGLCRRLKGGRNGGLGVLVLMSIYVCVCSHTILKIPGQIKSYFLDCKSGLCMYTYVCMIKVHTYLIFFL